MGQSCGVSVSDMVRIGGYLRKDDSPKYSHNHVRSEVTIISGSKGKLGCAESSALVLRTVLVPEGCRRALTSRPIAMPYLTFGLHRSAPQKCSGRCTPTARLRDLPHLRFEIVRRIGCV